MSYHDLAFGLAVSRFGEEDVTGVAVREREDAEFLLDVTVVLDDEVRKLNVEVAADFKRALRGALAEDGPMFPIVTFVHSSEQAKRR